MRAIVAARLSVDNRNATKGGSEPMSAAHDDRQQGNPSEADGILRPGLQTILGRHGEVHIVGSYCQRD
jgi:hypothetical protein